MRNTKYSLNVFINCPFDNGYLDLRNALVFTIFDCGFIPRCALEEDNGLKVRFEKIKNLIQESMFGVHDISRTNLDEIENLPRFNMPFELGVFIGAQRFGSYAQKNKNCLIVDREKYRYQIFLSDIAGHDIRSHQDHPEELIKHVRNWLNTASKGKTILPGARAIIKKFRLFEKQLPELCSKIPIDINELTYNDYAQLISKWLKEYSNEEIMGKE